MPDSGPAIPQLTDGHRAVSADTRKLFKKHTPPIVYIPAGEAHRD